MATKQSKTRSDKSSAASGTSKRNKGRNNKNYEPKKVDQMKVAGPLKVGDRKNDPNYYFKDATQAELLSRIQMNAFGGVTQLCPHAFSDQNAYNPAVVGYYLNPCPGVTPISWTAEEKFPPSEFDVLGINRAAQKLWYILTAKSGRSAGYSKSEISKLLLAEGEMISVYEFIRRAFGIAYTYSQRNRAVPTMLWQAMMVDPDDFRANAAVYLKKMNTLMATMNSIPIPGNIAYFAKCQGLYQNIFMDAPSELAQIFMLNPSTTWVLEEDDGFVGGSYLRTVDMCNSHAEGTRTIGYNINGGLDPVEDGDGLQLTAPTMRPLSYYIDVFNQQINALLGSSNFSLVYSDILRAFDTGTLSRWTFDYIDEKYFVVPIYNESMLWQIHNATVMNGLNTVTRKSFQEGFNGEEYWLSFKDGTPFNDVYEWGANDVLIYNPPVNTCRVGKVNGAIDLSDNIIDFGSDNPSVEDRIENTRFTVAGHSDDWILDMIPQSVAPQVDLATIHMTFELPDHWIESSYVYFYENQEDVIALADRRFVDNHQSFHYSELLDAPAYTKYHLAPICVVPNDIADATKWCSRDSVWGELNFWTNLDYRWFKDINDMIYVDLFDIR